MGSSGNCRGFCTLFCWTFCQRDSLFLLRRTGFGANRLCRFFYVCKVRQGLSLRYILQHSFLFARAEAGAFLFFSHWRGELGGHNYACLWHGSPHCDICNRGDRQRLALAANGLRTGNKSSSFEENANHSF